MGGNDHSHGLTSFFTVEVGGISLGDWMKCTGLQAKAKWETVHNPGDYSYKRILFADIDYSPVKLVRAISSDSASVEAVQKWVASKLTYDAQPAFTPDDGHWNGETAAISLYSTRQKLVHTWVLSNVVPASYKGPDFDAKKADVATETLELAHEGFLSLDKLVGKN